MKSANKITAPHVADEFSAMFPGLPIAITAADGTERVELVPDPRSSFARAYAQHDESGGVRFRDPTKAQADSGVRTIAPQEIHLVALVSSDREEVVCVDRDEGRVVRYAENFNRLAPEHTRAVVRTINIGGLAVIRESEQTKPLHAVRRVDPAKPAAKAVNRRTKAVAPPRRRAVPQK